MLRRCYSPSSLQRYPKYADVEVCKDWQTFSIFLTWAKTQDWTDEAMLDKDLIGNGLLYGPDTCCILPHHMNSFIMDKMTDFTGSYFKFKDGRVNAWVGQVHVKGSKKYLGVFPSAEKAHKAWQESKAEEARRLYKIYNHKLTSEVKVAWLGIISKIELDISLECATKTLIHQKLWEAHNDTRRITGETSSGV